ncbi:Rieske (2Fe-2S) protein [Hoyosella altamirensis]|uniref:Nitrite reductase (NADH) small subunit n=1 Tax=Hoyosella altamirensis TaxID=616997 RepID=A0A839RPP8_9ACTN|nr:Rieske (2Fe-2S) protein [Hoyosella altamirensis]MBB3037963.1 nitrite reductase (NADH) small subunit [Hoyosella altamirensis]
MSWVTVGHVRDLTPGEGRTFVVDGHQIAVFLLPDGSLRATAAVCPHKGGPLADGQIDSNVVVCPLHQYAFAFESGLCTTGEVEAVPVYAARLLNEEIHIRL